MAVRYPRGNGEGAAMKPYLRELPIGKGELLRDGETLAILAIGSSVYPALAAAERLSKEGIQCAVANARFAKPLDSDLILGLASRMPLITVEENVVAGGFGSAVAELLSNSELAGVKIEHLGLPDEFVEHGSQEILRSICNLDCEGIVQKIKLSFPELFVVPSARRGLGNI
jgi:1-deoxy-D-xylulose-5-phosphate synthase